MCKGSDKQRVSVGTLPLIPTVLHRDTKGVGFRV